MCVLVGVASLNEMFMSGFSPLASSVQTPFGPLEIFANKKLRLLEIKNSSLNYTMSDIIAMVTVHTVE